MNNSMVANQPLVSVIVPVYNCEQYVAKCLKSISNNTYQNLEIICIDDGSTDQSLARIKECAEKDQRIVVIQKANGGVSSARNAALEMAHGDYISFIDADDWVHRDFFVFLVREMNSDCDVVFCGMRNYSGTVSETVINNIESVTYTGKQALRVRNAFTYVCARIYRAKCFSTVRFNETISIGEDMLINHHIFPQCTKIKQLNVEPYYRLVRDNSAIHTRNPQSAIALIKEFIILAENENPEDTVLLERAYRSVLSGRYKNAITPDTMYYADLSLLIARLKKQSYRFTLKKRIVYNYFIDSPMAFKVLSEIRKIIRDKSL